MFGFRLQLFPQRRHLATELALLERVGERDFEIRFVEWLAHEVRGAELHRLDDGGRSALPGEHDDGDFPIDLPEGREHLEPVHGTWHHNVEDHRRRALDVVALHRFLGTAKRDRLVAALGEKRPEEAAHRQIVVDHHYLRLAVHSGPVRPWGIMQLSHGRHGNPLSNANASTENFWRD